MIGSDEVSLGASGSAVFADKNVGTGKTVNITDLGLSGSAALNYVLSATNTSTTADITARSLTVSADGVNKVYDGTAAATVTLSDDRLAGDVLSVSYTSASFADKNVGTGKTVSVSGISISGTDAANYTLTSSLVASATADISARAVTVTAAGDSKAYDGTTASAGMPTLTVGTLANGDTAVWTQMFDSQNVGTGKALTPAGTVNDGNGGNNYSVSFLDNTSGVITARPITVTADTKSKVYGDVDPALTCQVTSGSLVSGDSLSGSPTRAVGENVGAYAIQQGSLTAGSNYNLTFVSADLTITAASSTTALLSSLNPSGQASNVTFTATVAPVSPGTTTPTGSVQFYANGIALGAPVALSGGVAGLGTAELPVGTNIVGAAYLGDGNYLVSSNSLAQVVTINLETPSTLGIRDNGDGTVTITFAGTPGAEYVVQAASDLGAPSWQNLSTNTAAANGQWTFTDSTVSQPGRFYRSAKP